MKRPIFHVGVILSLVTLVVLAYSPGLHGPYILDDEENITLNKAVAVKEITPSSIHDALLSNQSGPFKRPLAALSFALNHYFAGGFDNTLPFKLTNVVIHIINSILIYYLLLLCLRRPALADTLTGRQPLHVAGFGALLWALHPIQLTSVLYVVQRMNSLSTLFVILGLIVFMHGRQAIEESKKYGFPAMASGIAGGALLGIGAKENAALLPLFAFVIELTLYHRNRLTPSARKWLWIFYLLTILLPVTIFISYVVMHPDFFMNSYAIRSFTPYERLLTETRVLWFYLSLLLLPSIQRLGLFHDDIAISHGLLQPISTLPAVLGIFAMLLFALIKFRRYPVASFAILWFLVGHSLESSIFGLEIAYEHRNYLPSFGVIFAAAYIIIKTLSGMSAKKNTAIEAILPSAIILVFGISTWTWANTWKETGTLAEYHALNRPDSPRANNYAANASIREKNDVISAIKYTIKGMQAAPDEAGFYLDMQLFLAYFASEIDSGLVRANIATRGKEFRIAGLPDSIQMRTIDGNIKFIHDSSSARAINELLQSKPISVHGVATMDKLTKCVTEHIALCKPLRRNAIEWLVSAAQNTRTAPEYRALISADAAKLYADIGDYQRALSYITAATQLFPSTVFYRLGKTEYLIKLGRVEEANTMLNSIEESGIPSGEDLETIKLLRKMQAGIPANRY